MRRLFLLVLATFFIVSPNIAWAVDPDLVVLYTFQEEQGDTIKDVSGRGTPLNLTVRDTNAIKWIPGGGLETTSPTVIESKSKATKIISACQATNEITIEAWVKSTDPTAAGPARIVTLSQDTTHRNFTMGQEEDAVGYEIRLRTTETSDNGMDPHAEAKGVLVVNELVKLAYTRNFAGEIKFYVNGEAVPLELIDGQGEAIGGDFSNWDDGYQLGLASELAIEMGAIPLKRYWLGEYHLVAIYSRALTADEIRDDTRFPVEPQGKLTATWGRIKALR
jgi:hypothetical protein